MHTINIASDFSRTPGGRYISDGPFSGELFRERVLAPALRTAMKDANKVIVILDGTRGYLSSFLEEAFGGLIRAGYFSKAEVQRYLEIRAIDPFYQTYQKLALQYIAEAKSETAVAS